MGITNLISPSAWESHILSVIFVKLCHYYPCLSGEEIKTQRDKMTRQVVTLFSIWL